MLLQKKLKNAKSTYIYRYRIQSSVWRLPNLLTTHPLSTQRVCPPPAPKAVRGWGGGGLIFRKTPDIGLASYTV